MRRPLGSLCVLLAISGPYVAAVQHPRVDVSADALIMYVNTSALRANALVYSTYSSDAGVVKRIAVDVFGRAHVTGSTSSVGRTVATSFPTTPGSFQPGFADGQSDALVANVGFQMSGGPAAPSSPNPPAGAIWVTVTPTLSWTSVDATSYEIRFGTANPPPTLVSNTTDWWYQTPPLNGGTRYFWQIVAKNDCGTTAGPIWSFSTDPTVAPPVISAVLASEITRFGATISWTTNAPSDSEVEYGLTTAYGSFSTHDLTPVIAHGEAIGGLNPGTLYHFLVRSRDAAGNLALAGDFTLTTLEGIPPSVSITAPSGGATLSGTVTVTANASDNVGVVGVRFQLDGVPLGGTVTAPYSVAWNTRTATNGSHMLSAVVWDAAGNQTTSTAVAVVVSNSQMALAWDLDPSVVGYKIYVGTASGTYTLNIDAGNVTTFTVTGLQSGPVYYFAVTAYDRNRNESAFSNEVSATLP
jgi:hypothetical protein